MNRLWLNQVEDALNIYQHSNLMNGLFVIAKQGEVIYEKAIYGAGENAAFTINTPFPIASVTKQFTAAAILLLVEQNKLALNEPIIKYLPPEHLIWANEVPDWAHSVTLHHCLNHTSGLISYTSEDINFLRDESHQLIVQKIITAIKFKVQLYKPGEQYFYCNTSYLLLCAIIETVCQERNLSQFLKNHIFEPFAMESTYLPSIEIEMALIKNVNKTDSLPIRYVANLSQQDKPKAIQALDFQIPYWGTAGMISTIHDLLKWHDALYHSALLSKEAFKIMHTPHVSGHSFLGEVTCGYGIFINDQTQSYRHGGWIEGVRAEVAHMPNQQLSIIYLSNLSPDEQQSEAVQCEQVKALYDLIRTIEKLVFSSP